MPRTSGEQNRPFTASFSAVSILTSIVMFPKPCLLCFLLLYSYNEVADYMSGAPANGFHIGALYHLFFRPFFSHGFAFEFYTMSLVNDPVHNCVGHSFVADNIIPFTHR